MSLFNKSQLYADNNKPRSIGLFKETRRSKNIEPYILCLSPHNKDVPSLYLLYLEFCTDDPTEVSFAEHVFGDYSFWLNLKENKELSPYFEKWFMVCEQRRKSKAFKAAVKAAEEGNMQAARFLIEEPWKTKTTPKARKQIKETTEKAYTEVSEDLERLREQGFIN